MEQLCKRFFAAASTGLLLLLLYLYFIQSRTDMYVHYRVSRFFQTLDQDLQQELKGKVSTAIEGAQNVQMKEIRGLGDRLSGLEQLLLEAKRLVQEQQKLAAAFVQNQQRASGLRDVSILPDLCASHRQQLLVMQKNHQQIISICNRSGWLLFIVSSFSFGPNLSF